MADDVLTLVGHLVDNFFDVSPPRREESRRRTELKIAIADALHTYGDQVARKTWLAAIQEAELVKLVQAENESMDVGFICAKNSILSNLKKASLITEG